MNSPNSRARRRISAIAAPLSTGTIVADDVPVPGEDAGDEAVGDALDEVPPNLAAHQCARLVGLVGDDRQDRLRSRKH